VDAFADDVLGGYGQARWWSVSPESRSWSGGRSTQLVSQTELLRHFRGWHLLGVEPIRRAIAIDVDLPIDDSNAELPMALKYEAAAAITSVLDEASISHMHFDSRRGPHTWIRFEVDPPVDLIQALASRLGAALAALGADGVELRPRGRQAIRLPLGIYLGLPRGPLEPRTTDELLLWLAEPERATETQLRAAAHQIAEQETEPWDGIVRRAITIPPPAAADQATPPEPPMPIRGWERWCPCKQSKYLAGLERRGERHFTYLMIAAEAALHAELSEDELIEIQLAMPLNGNSQSTDSERRVDARSNARSVLAAKAEEPVLTGCPRNQGFADRAQSTLRSVFAHHCTEERSRICPLLHPVWPRQTAYGPLLESSIWRGSQGGGSGVGLTARAVYEFAVMRSQGMPGPIALTGRYIEARLPYLTRKSAEAALSRLVEIGLFEHDKGRSYILQEPLDAQGVGELETELGTHEHASRALERFKTDWERLRAFRRGRGSSSH
jgi:hypothetical protein